MAKSLSVVECFTVPHFHRIGLSIVKQCANTRVANDDRFYNPFTKSLWMESLLYHTEFTNTDKLTCLSHVDFILFLSAVLNILYDAHRCKATHILAEVSNTHQPTSHMILKNTAPPSIINEGSKAFWIATIYT